MTEGKRGDVGTDQPSLEEQAQQIQGAFRLCYHCCKPIEGRAFLVSLKGRDKKTLCVKRASYRWRGMHEACAQSWIERARLTADLYGRYPEIAEAYREYIDAVARGFKQIEAIRAQISAKNDYLSATITHHYRRHIEALKTGEPVPPPNQELLAHWKSWATNHFGEACEQAVKLSSAPAAEAAPSPAAAPPLARAGSSGEQTIELPTQEAIDGAKRRVDVCRTMLTSAEAKLQRLRELKEAVRSRSIIRFPGRKRP